MDKQGILFDNRHAQETCFFHHKLAMRWRVDTAKAPLPWWLHSTHRNHFTFHSHEKLLLHFR